MKTLKEIVGKRFYDSIKKDKEVIAVFLFGSYARGEKYRDIDLCIILDKKYNNLRMAKKRLKYSSLVPTNIDIQVFQQLPVYVRKRVLREGRRLLCKNEDMLYDIAFATIKEFGFYKKIYDAYLNSMETVT
ncbi:nucleotidyltransferase domain-containing protein [Candidatus Woesearchaeota archaeon]|nr:nucleotidyltransferase domain-containing protein [Candidatus Woesearchaeota archaeon]